MGGRSAVAAVVALALGATVVDFAGRLLSTLADGAFMAGVVAVVVGMHRRHRAEVMALRRQVQEARAREVAAERGADALAAMANKREAGR